jgi:hypothetical protein
MARVDRVHCVRRVNTPLPEVLVERVLQGSLPSPVVGVHRVQLATHRPLEVSV